MEYFFSFRHAMVSKQGGICFCEASNTIGREECADIQADIWIVAPEELFGRSNNDSYESMYGILSSEEKAKADRFFLERDRNTFISAHSALRLILARKSGCSPLEVSFGMGRHGKPFMQGAPCIHFNISHSGDVAVIAVSKNTEIGVDIEKLDRCSSREFLELAKTFFSESEVRWISERDICERFLRCWCLRESALKAEGVGLSRPLDTFSVVPPCCNNKLEIKGSHVKVLEFQPITGYIGAAALLEHDNRV